MSVPRFRSIAQSEDGKSRGMIEQRVPEGAARSAIKKGGLRRPRFGRSRVSDSDNRDDPVVAVDDDDLITNDEVHITAPFGIDLDEQRGNRHHTDAGRNGGADAQREVDVGGTRCIAAGQDRLSDLGALLRRQVDAAARLALLRLTLLRLPLPRRLAWLSLALLRRLTWLAGLALLRRLTALALLTLLALRRLAGALTLLTGLTFLIALLLRLATLLGLILLALLRVRFALTLRRLACGLSFLAALRLALLLSLRRLLGLALLRLLALGSAAALFSSALHALS
jgi:hypothetical protein